LDTATINAPSTLSAYLASFLLIFAVLASTPLMNSFHTLNNATLARHHLLDARLEQHHTNGSSLPPPQPEPVASPQPDDEFKLLDFNLDDFSKDFEFNEWNTAFIADADAGVT
jgi:hypothetical protein